LDSHSKTIQKQPTRKRNYDDTRFVDETPRPENLPDWTYCSDMGEEEEQKGKGKQKEAAKGKGKSKEQKKKLTKRRKTTDYEETVIYSTDEEHRTGETSKTGEIRGALKPKKSKK
jgi:hypothetical protein